jgi:hypothetical protein
MQEMPTHPITAAAYYSLACVEFAQDHAEVAKYVYPWSQHDPFQMLTGTGDTSTKQGRSQSCEAQIMMTA